MKLFCITSPLATIYALIAIWRKDGRSLADLAATSTVVDADTLSPPARLSLMGRAVASVLAVIGPLVIAILVLVSLFGFLLAGEILNEVAE